MNSKIHSSFYSVPSRQVLALDKILHKATMNDRKSLFYLTGHFGLCSLDHQFAEEVDVTEYSWPWLEQEVFHDFHMQWWHAIMIRVRPKKLPLDMPIPQACWYFWESILSFIPILHRIVVLGCTLTFLPAKIKLRVKFMDLDTLSACFEVTSCSEWKRHTVLVLKRDLRPNIHLTVEESSEGSSWEFLWRLWLQHVNTRHFNCWYAWYLCLTFQATGVTASCYLKTLSVQTAFSKHDYHQRRIHYLVLIARIWTSDFPT